MATALAERAIEREHEAGSGAAGAVGSAVGAAAGWVGDTAKDALSAAGERVRDRTEAGVASYTRADPMRALGIAAATGAVLMVLVLMTARSAVRSGERLVRRHGTR